jgi:hypothetical protein
MILSSVQLQRILEATLHPIGTPQTAVGLVEILGPRFASL